VRLTNELLTRKRELNGGADDAVLLTAFP